jgi:hypothetical protein
MSQKNVGQDLGRKALNGRKKGVLKIVLCAQQVALMQQAGQMCFDMEDCAVESQEICTANR